MIKALKVVLIVFGVVGILLGLLLVFFPDKLASNAGVNEVSGYLQYTMASFGILVISANAFIIVAARDPLRHINWVKFAIASYILGTVAGLYSIIKGNIEFSHAGTLIIIHAVFAVVLLALYPYRRPKGS
jgi:hypothetical protein